MDDSLRHTNEDALRWEKKYLYLVKHAVIGLLYLAGSCKAYQQNALKYQQLLQQFRYKGITHCYDFFSTPIKAIFERL